MSWRNPNAVPKGLKIVGLGVVVIVVVLVFTLPRFDNWSLSETLIVVPQPPTIENGRVVGRIKIEKSPGLLPLDPTATIIGGLCLIGHPSPAVACQGQETTSCSGQVNGKEPYAHKYCIRSQCFGKPSADFVSGDEYCETGQTLMHGVSLPHPNAPKEVRVDLRPWGPGETVWVVNSCKRVGTEMRCSASTPLVLPAL